MKTILVPTGGSASDLAVFETAVVAARPFASHLHFLHVHIGAGQAAQHIPHAAFARGPALSSALAELDAAAAARSANAVAHVREFCARAHIDMRDTPAPSDHVTASCQVEESGAVWRIMFQARHHDLVVVGRATKPNGLPVDFLEELLLGCGRPVLIAGAMPPQTISGTIMVGWRETAEAARAVAAAMPFLARAKRVVVVSVADGGADAAAADAMAGVARQLAWNGAPAETQIIAPKGRPTPVVLAEAAEACAADLVVLGAYGHSRMRELLFGGCTKSFIEYADRPVLLMH